jgi:hypothetical protein
MPFGKDIVFNTNDSNIQSKITTSYGIYSEAINTPILAGQSSFPSVNGALTDSWSSAPYTFTTTASSTINSDNRAAKAWNRYFLGRWVSGNGSYNSTTGLPITGTATTVDGSPVQGQWLQLEINVAVSVGAFYLNGDFENTDNGRPVDFQFVGSDDNVNYTLMSSFTNQTVTSTGKRYENTVFGTFRYYRIIITKTTTDPYSATRCLIGNMTMLYLDTQPAFISILNKAITVNADNFYSDNFIKKGGTNIQ